LEATLGVLDSWRTASWQFTNDDSALYQHYPISDVCWHAGFEANKKCVGVENTGRKGEPLTDRQYDHLLALHLWLREQGVLTVCERRVDLWEHNEWMATDCPSGRIPWDRLIADLKEEGMDEEERKKLDETAAAVLNLQAEQFVAARLLVAAGAVLQGSWASLPRSLKEIEESAKIWHRWPGD